MQKFSTHQYRIQEGQGRRTIRQVFSIFTFKLTHLLTVDAREQRVRQSRQSHVDRRYDHNIQNSEPLRLAGNGAVTASGERRERQHSPASASGARLRRREWQPSGPQRACAKYANVFAKCWMCILYCLSKQERSSGRFCGVSSAALIRRGLLVDFRIVWMSWSSLGWFLTENYVRLRIWDDLCNERNGFHIRFYISRCENECGLVKLSFGFLKCLFMKKSVGAKLFFFLITVELWIYLNIFF